MDYTECVWHQSFYKPACLVASSAQVEALESQKDPNPKSSEMKGLIKTLKVSHDHALADSQSTKWWLEVIHWFAVHS